MSYDEILNSFVMEDVPEEDEEEEEVETPSGDENTGSGDESEEV